MRVVIFAIAIVAGTACRKSENQLDANAVCAKYLEVSLRCSGKADVVVEDKAMLEKAMLASCIAAMTDSVGNAVDPEAARRRNAAERAAATCVANAADCDAARACYDKK